MHLLTSMSYNLSMVSRAQLLEEQTYQAPAAGLGSLSLNQDLARTFGDQSANSEWHRQNDLNLGAQSGNIQRVGFFEADQDDRDEKAAKQGAVNRQIRTSSSIAISNTYNQTIESFYKDRLNNFNGFTDVDPSTENITMDDFDAYGDKPDARFAMDEQGNWIDRENGDKHLAQDDFTHIQNQEESCFIGTAADGQAAEDALAEVESAADLQDIDINKVPPEVIKKLTGQDSPSEEEIGMIDFEELRSELRDYTSLVDEDGKFKHTETTLTSEPSSLADLTAKQDLPSSLVLTTQQPALTI